MRWTTIVKSLVIIGLLASMASVAPRAAASEIGDETVGATPPRLSYIDGQVSYWRPGAEQWVQAQINTALAPGDELFVSGAGNLELQIGAQAFVRAGADTQIVLETREPDFLRFKIVSGQVALDIRSLTAGRTVAVVTAQSDFTINNEGYYRFDVSEARTSLVTRRNGRTTVTGPDGNAIPVSSDERVVIQGPAEQSIAFQVAPEIDDWDHWNYDRTDQLMASQSLNYVSAGTYGVSDLDRYGAWRVLPTYGPVWIPSGVGASWAPYSTGSWVHDPFYGWTWVDAAPWGWAPYHYGRWLYVHNYWCWAPGPRVRRVVYAPALVAFLGQPGVSIGVSIGGPAVGWVALGWGEPLVPWWGRAGFIHKAWWGGWGGPHFVNGERIGRHAVVHVDRINRYHNMHVHHAIVAVEGRHFGHGPIARDRFKQGGAKAWRPSHQAPGFHRTAAAYAPSIRPGPRPVVIRGKNPAGRRASHPNGMSRSADRSRSHFTPASRPVAPARTPNPSQSRSGVHRFDKADHPAPPAAGSHSRPAGSPGALRKGQAQQRSRAATVFSRSKPQPSHQVGPDHAAGSSMIQRRRSSTDSIRPTIKSPQRPMASGARQRSQHPAAARRPPSQANQPGSRPAETKHSGFRPALPKSSPLGDGSARHPRVNLKTSPARVSPPQAPSRQPERKNYFQEKTRQNAAPSVAAPRDSFVPSPRSGSHVGGDRGARSGFESPHGFGRRARD